MNTKARQVHAQGRWSRSMQRCASLAVLALAWLLAAGTATAQQAETLQSLSFSSLPGAGLQVRLEFDAQPPQTSGFTLDEPPRVSIDLPGISSALGQREFPISANVANNLMVLETSDRTRLVFNLERPMSYDASTDGNSLVISLGQPVARTTESGDEQPGDAQAGAQQSDAGQAQQQQPPVAQQQGDQQQADQAQTTQQQTAQQQTAPVQSTTAPQPGDVEGPAITDFNFQRGDAEGEALMSVQLSDPDIRAQAERQGRQVVVEFRDTQVPEHLNRRFEVTDFATPVSTVDLLPQRGNASLIVDVGEDFEYVAWQEGDQYNVSVRPVDTQEELEDPAEQYSDTRISLSFQDMNVRSVLQILADEHDFNLVVSDAVSGTVTLHLEDVPWDQALDLVLQSRNLDKRLVGNVLYVAPASEIATQQQLALEAQQQAQRLEPLQTEYIQVNYADAANILELLTGSATGDTPGGGGDSGGGGATGGAGGQPGASGGGQQVSAGGGQQQGGQGDSESQAPVTAGEEPSGILSSRGTATVDPRTNIIIIRDVPSKLEEVRELLSRLDVPVRQVLIEARIVNVSTDFSRDLGVRWGAAGRPGGSNNFHYGGSLESALEQNNNRVAADQARQDAVEAGEAARQDALQEGTNPSLIDGLVDQAMSSVDIPQGNVSFPEALALDLGAQAQEASSFAIGFARNSNLIELELSALESSGNGEVIARPKVTTQDKVTADISSGVRIPYQAQAGGTAGGSTTEFVEAVLSLEVTPQITPDGRIIMRLNITQDSVSGSASGGGQPPIDTNSINTTVLVDNGDTVVLGGIFREETTTQETKTPILGDVPYLGRLFKRTNRSSRRTELLIFITPRIIEELGSA